ncbi:MAG: hypothetical protein C0478_08350 [Planctomyces sp.]|nr:hypothetical protein [Planctomyces sp.]
MALVHTEIKRQLEVYRKSRPLTSSCWIVIGCLYLGVVALAVLFLSELVLRLPWYSLIDGLYVIGTLGLIGLTGATFIICGIAIRWNHWPSILVGYWTTFVTSLLILFSPACFLIPLYEMVFLESREFCLAARYLVEKGFDLRNLPAESDPTLI